MANDTYRGLDIMTKLERFALAVLEESRDEPGDLDGGWIQDEAEKLGLLVRVEVVSSCGDSCNCAYKDFPQDCLRYSPEVEALVLKGEKG